MNDKLPTDWAKSAHDLARAAVESVQRIDGINHTIVRICSFVKILTDHGMDLPPDFHDKFFAALHTFHRSYIRFLSELDQIDVLMQDIQGSIRVGDGPAIATSSPGHSNPLDSSAMRLPNTPVDRTRPFRDLHQLLDQIPAMIGYWDANLINRFANQDYRTWFGLQPQEIMGRHIKDVIGAERYALNLPYITAALSGQPQQFIRDIVDPTGRCRRSLARYIPDIQDGKTLGFFAFVTDITVVSPT